jgi:hypothetical protein
VEGDRRGPSWLKATIRAALIATAVGGGFFVLSQVLAPSEAHAETVGSASSDPSLLGPALKGAGAALGSVTGTADSGVSAVTGTATSAVEHASIAASTVVSKTVNTLPAPVRVPVQKAVARVTKTVPAVTAPVARIVSAVPRAHLVSGTIGTVTSTADSAVAAVETTPMAGSLVEHLIGTDPAAALLTPTATNVERVVGTAVAAVGTTLTSTGDAVATAGSDNAGNLLPGTGALAALDDEPGSAASTAGARRGDASATVDAAIGPFFVATSLFADGSVPATSAIDTAALDGGQPGLPGLPQSPDSQLATAGSGAAAGGRAGGNGSGSAPFGTLDGFGFPAGSAGLCSVADEDALPASPVFDNDSTPD